MKFFDSTFLVDYLRGVGAVEEYLERHEEAEFATSSINLKEIAVGELLADDPDRREILGDFGWLRIEPFETRHALVAAEIEANLRRNGSYEPHLAADILIAGVARALDATVVTRNTNDFERFAGISVESY